MITTGGVTVTVGKVDLLEVSQHAGFTTAGSAYKIWATQEEFRADVLRYVLEGTSPDRATIDAVTEALRADPDSLPPLRELIRTFAGDAQGGWASGATTYAVYLALWAASDADPELAARLAATDAAVLDALTQMYMTAMDVYGLEMVPPYTPAMLATTLSAMVEGLAVREQGAPGTAAMTGLERHTGPEGSAVPWTLYACCVEAVVAAFTRPRVNVVDPDVANPDDPVSDATP